MVTQSSPALTMPSWGGKLDFRKARIREVSRLKELYDSAWGKGITISEGQLRSSIRNFPHGQIVGVEKGSDAPVSMINIMLSLFEAEKGFRGGYSEVTGNRTFSTSIEPIRLASLAHELEGRALAMAFCVSIAVPPAHARAGYANETLNYAIEFASSNGLIAAPYTAPRGFARAREACPGLDIIDYLHLTVPSGRYETDPETSFLRHLAKISVMRTRLAPVFGEEPLASREMFDKYNSLGEDSPAAGAGRTAYSAFLGSDDCADFISRFRRIPTIEDFTMLTGRALMDPVIGMHVGNGARFIRNDEGGITAVFADSRPEDRASLGYNVVVSYGYHPLLGHELIERPIPPMGS